MSTAEELVAVPSSNGVESSSLNDHSPKTEKIESKNIADTEKTEPKEKMSAEINHESSVPTTDVEMKEVKDKTPEPDHPPSQPPPIPEKPADERTANKKDVIDDKSGEEKFECVTVKPLTTADKAEGKSESKSETAGAEKTGAETVEEAAAAGERKEVDEDEEEQELDSSPKKRGKRAAPRKATPKKSPRKATAATKPTDDGAEEHMDEDAEKSTPKEEASSPKKTETPRKSQRSQEKTADTSPKTPVDKTPLLEAPLVIEGKRTRQRVERLDTQLLTPTQKEVEIPHGTGSKLGEIPFVEAMISKTPANDLKSLHKVLYGRLGTPQEIKKNLRGFCGFGYAANSKEFEKKRKSLDNYQMKDLKKICEVVGLERGGRKEELVEHLMNYLVEPKDHGKKPPQPASAKRKRSSSRKSSGKGAKSRKSGSAKKAGKETSEGSGDDDDDDDEDNEEEEEAKEEESDKEEEHVDEAEEEEEQPKSKKAKKEKPSTSAASTPSKRGQPKRGSTKKPTFPSDTDIKNTIRELLKGMNLEEVTMKEMTKKVYDKYPAVDISNKKDFIKETVKALLSASD